LTGSKDKAVARESQITHTAPLLAGFLRLSLPALGIWMAIAGLSTLPSEYYAERARRALRDWKYVDCEQYADLGLDRTSRNPYLYWYKGEAQAGMAETSIERGAREELLEQAAGNFRNAVALFPREENFVLSLGWTLDGLRRFAESEPVFLRALDLDPRSPQMQFHYATHLHLVGRRAEAEAWYHKARAAGSPSAEYGLRRLAEERKTAGASSIMAGDPAK
jgi:tetratricopeptide (TPR) repeat protein